MEQEIHRKYLPQSVPIYAIKGKEVCKNGGTDK